MLPVSNDFKLAMKQPVKELQAYIDENGTAIRGDDDLISFKISCDTGLCKTAMRKLEATYIGEHNLLGKWVHAGYGVRLPSGAFEYLDYGSFLVSEQTVTKDTGITNIVAYDKMVESMTPYQVLDVEYPIDLLTYTGKLCEACGLELGSELFGYNLWDVSKEKNHNNVVYDEATGIYSAEDNDTRTPLAYKVQQYIGTDYIEEAYVIKDVTHTGVYKFTTTRVENATNIRIANNGVNREFSIFYPLPNSIAVGDTFTVTIEVIDDTIGASKFKNIMLQKGNGTQPFSLYNTMNDWTITQELWENIDGITYRDILQQIAQATASTCIVKNDDKIYFKPITATGEQLTYDNMFKLKLDQIYGEINSVVLSRTPQEDNVFLRDEASIHANGLTEFKIENNEIIDKDRENAITPIFNALRGISYYPFESTTEGLGWYEIADSFDIINDTEDVFNTSLFNFSITVDGSLKETLKTVAETKTQTQYQYATSIAKRVKNTEIIVNKQEQRIESLVTDIYEEDGVVNQKLTKVVQDINGVVTSIQNSGGSNLIKNSVMFDNSDFNLNDNYTPPSSWEMDGGGTLTFGSNAESVSQYGFTLADMLVYQVIPVTIFDSENPVYYSFSTKIKKGSAGRCYVKIYNDSEEHIIPLEVGQEAYYTEYVLEKLEPKENWYCIEFYGSADSYATFTDNMLAVGEYKSQWTQANGEVMNTNVVMNKDGITVKNVDAEGNTTGDYTVISTLEFAGYSYVNGTKTKVFSLNKDITEVSKLNAQKEIAMSPIKIVPITEGDLQGWAFVPSTKEV